MDGGRGRVTWLQQPAFLSLQYALLLPIRLILGESRSQHVRLYVVAVRCAVLTADCWVGAGAWMMAQWQKTHGLATTGASASGKPAFSS